MAGSAVQFHIYTYSPTYFTVVWSLDFSVAYYFMYTLSTGPSFDSFSHSAFSNKSKKNQSLSICIQSIAQLVEALHYKPEGRGFHSR
jgi:hypothetical protein